MIGGALLVVLGVLAVVWGRSTVRRVMSAGDESPLAPGGPTFGPWRGVLTGSAVMIVGSTLLIGGAVRLFSGG